MKHVVLSSEPNTRPDGCQTLLGCVITSIHDRVACAPHTHAHAPHIARNVHPDVLHRPDAHPHASRVRRVDIV